MKKVVAIFAVLTALFVALEAGAIPGKSRRNLKLPSQALLEKQEITDPAAAGTTQVLSANAGATSAAAATVTTFVAQPDVPRNLVITPGGTTGDVEACTVTVTGTNILDDVITEGFAFLADASTATTGTKAFKTITSIGWAASCESGGFAATWSVGYGEKLGLRSCLDAAGDWAWSRVGGTYESTRATVVADADEVEKNTADFNGTMNGTNDFVAYFVQNFACL